MIITGDCLAVLPTLDAASVQCCVTSPPYWGLRDYGGHPAQIGLEKTPELYVEHLVAVFREVKRVLRGDGTLWLNMGDTYAAERGGSTPPAETLAGGVGGHGAEGTHRGRVQGYNASRNARAFGLKHKDLVGIPWLVAFALRADGWYLRGDIIWHKANPMPESVTDRPTKGHEYLFLLAKSEKYFYDAEAIAEPVVGAADPAVTRNKRTVWKIPTQSYKGAHFAVFPEALAEPCILAGSSEKGCCCQCKAPWKRVIEHPGNPEGILGYRGVPNAQTLSGGFSVSERYLHTERGVRLKPGHNSTQYRKTKTCGWKLTCRCGTETPECPCVVLDPFVGSGTVGVVAHKLGRRFVGIELNPEYVELAEARLAKVAS